ncbi:MAG: hypothetical protein P8X55_21215, partial [Desulfosarcinaceae bacterium]
LMDPSYQPAASEMIMENREAIESFGRVIVGGVVGRIDDFAHPPREAYLAVDKLLAGPGLTGGSIRS